MNLEIIKDINDFLNKNDIFFDDRIYFDPKHETYEIDFSSNELNKLNMKDEYYIYIKFTSKNKSKKLLKFKRKLENKYKDIIISFCDINKF